MSDDRTTQDEEVLVLTEDQRIDDEPSADEGDDGAQADEQGEEYLSFGSEEEQAPANEPETDLIKKLRREIRERDKQLSQVRKQPQAEEPVVVGDRPTMEACDYDDDKFAQEFDAWEARKEAKRAQDSRLEQGRREQEQRWQQVQEGYQSGKRSLKFSDKEEAEAAAFEELSEVQQAVIASVAENPALVIYAVGKNPAKLAELSGITDPLKLARQIGRMEATMAVKKRAKVTAPDTPVRGSVVTAASVDKHEAKLEAEADRTGDRTKLIQYRRDKRQKQA